MREIPHSYEAEAAVIGSIMQENSLPTIIDMLKSDDFYDSRHRLIYEQAVCLHNEGEPVDLVTTSENLKAIGKLKKVGGDYYITELIESVPFPSNVNYYAKIVFEKSQLRKMIVMGERLKAASESASADFEEIKNELMNELLELERNMIRGQYVPGREINKTTMEYLEELRQRNITLTGVTTGYSRLDENLLGFQPSDLIILASRPSMGKTALALCMAYNADCPVGFVSIEMTGRQLWIRLLSISSTIDHWKIKKGWYSKEQDSLLTASEELSDREIFIDDSGKQSINSLRTRAKLLKLKHNVGIIFIDYLQLIEHPTPGKSTNDNVGMITRHLKMLAKELDVPIVLLSQLSRKCEDRNPKAPRPKLSDLRDSGKIEEDADVVMLIYRDAYYCKDSEDVTAEINIAKHRNGETGVTKLAFIKERTAFEELATY